MYAEAQLKALESPFPKDRLDTWLWINKEIAVGRFPLDEDSMRRLLNYQKEETNGQVWRAALETIHTAFLAMYRKVESKEGGASSQLVPPPQAAPAQPGRKKSFDGLGQWIWDDFHGRSLVLRATDCDSLRRRDEDAVIKIARALPREDFPLTAFPRVLRGQYDPGVAGLDEVVAIAFTGRLNLYFDTPHKLRAWEPEKEPLRFTFGEDERPADWPPGKLHPVYHRILERISPDGDVIEFRAEDRGNRRTDFGLVQRYVLRRANRDIVVLRCAGCTPAGTLGAAGWGAGDVFARNAEGRLLPLPPEINVLSRLEALIKVTLETASPVPTWELEDVKLEDLRVDNYAWYGGPGWEQAAPKLITLRRGPNNTIREVWLDCRQARLKDDSENLHLLVSVCRLAAASQGRVPIRELVEDSSIWKEDHAVSPADVRNRLHGLKRLYLGRALQPTEDPDVWQLTAQVRFK